VSDWLFKSYYVVWKPLRVQEKIIERGCLNRTM